MCEPDAGARGREEEDFTRDRSDFKDATIIAKKVTELRCYVPYQLEGHWCRLRHLGARRNDQLTAAGAARQGLRELLDCAWPTVLQAAADPLDALTSGRFRHLTTRTDNPLHHGPARAAIAAALCCASCSSSSPAGSPGTSPSPPAPAPAPRGRWRRRPHDATLATGGASPTLPWVEPVSEQGRPAHPPPELV